MLSDSTDERDATETNFSVVSYNSLNIFSKLVSKVTFTDQLELRYQIL